MTRADYACSGSEDEVTRRCLAKDHFQDWIGVSRDRSSRSQDRSDKG